MDGAGAIGKHRKWDQEWESKWKTGKGRQRQLAADVLNEQRQTQAANLDFQQGIIVKSAVVRE